MIIPTTSKGSLVAGDEHVVEVTGETPPEYLLRILARVRYQIRLTSKLIADSEVVIVVR